VGIFPTPPSSIPPPSPSPSSSQPALNTTSPPQPRAEFNDPIFSSLLSQTRAYLAGPDFAYALSAALDRATVVLVDGLRAKVFVDSNTTNDPEGLSATNPIDLTVEEETKEEIKIRLAGLLPGLARWSQLALNAVPNELVDVSLRFLCFLWFSVFCCVSFCAIAFFRALTPCSSHLIHVMLCVSVDLFNRMSWRCANSVHWRRLSCQIMRIDTLIDAEK